MFANLAAFSASWNKCLEVVSPDVVILCKTLWCAGDREISIYLLKYSDKLGYLQQISVLVDGSSPPKSHKQGYLNL